MSTSAASNLGWIKPGALPASPARDAIVGAIQALDSLLCVVDGADGPQVIVGGEHVGPSAAGAVPIRALVPALTPDRLGDASFCATYGTRVAYAAGAMANGIASTAIVIAMARAGMIGFFGSAGLPTARIRAALDEIQAAVGDLPYGFNLIHSPQEPHQEQETVDLYLARGVRVVEAAAYLGLTPMIVHYRAAGLSRAADGSVQIANHVIAKVSRTEVADKFLRPAPQAMLDKLVAEGRISAEQAELARRVPMCDDITAEADSGGHTDNRPLPVLLPLMIAHRDRVCAELGYAIAVRVGAAGGICTPASAASAFALGAAYVVTGTINQACVEAGTSPMVKQLLAEAGTTDVGMAPASDMFEAGVEVQVLKRGTAFAMRGRQLYELYRAHEGLDDLPADVRARLEKQIFRRPLADVWAECERFFAERDPRQLERAARDPRHQMALVFRWYLGLSSRWAIAGELDRKLDAQIWCGPGIGAFNDWTAGTFLAEPAERRVVVVAANIMAGAAALTRAQWLAHQGIDPGPIARTWTPRPLATDPPRVTTRSPALDRTAHV